MSFAAAIHFRLNPPKASTVISPLSFRGPCGTEGTVRTNERAFSLASSALLVTAALLVAVPARANGRFPAADQLIVDPSNPQHLVVRTTFGFLDSVDGGKEWRWTCEEIVGRIASQDPPFTVTGDGTVVVAVPFEGVSVTHDRGCTWSRAPAPLAGQLAVDVTLVPNEPASMVVLTSTNDTDFDAAGPDAPSEFRNLVVETKDDARSWTLLGTPLARDFIAATIEIAHSDPNRIYASGVFVEPADRDATIRTTLRGAIERSEDRGQTWTRAFVPSPPGLSGVYISAVDPANADRLFVRVLLEPDPVTGASPTTLLVSSDKGATWKELAHTDEAMLGFALSPDGSTLAYGTIGQGIFLGPPDGSSPFENVSKIQNRCLTWTPAGLYACNTDLGRSANPPNDFAVGISHDRGATFDKLYRLYETCPTTCPEDSVFNRTCRMTWEMKPGITVATGATGETCTVPWAKTATPDGGAGGSGAGGGPGGSAGSDAGATPPGSEQGSSCSCRMTARFSDARMAGVLSLVGIAWRTLRLRRRARTTRARSTRG